MAYTDKEKKKAYQKEYDKKHYKEWQEEKKKRSHENWELHLQGKKRNPRVYEFKDISGQRFGRLLVIEKTNERSGSNIKWRCQCDCGNIIITSGHNLRKGLSKSCGCWKDELSSERARLKEGNSNLNILFLRYKNNAKEYNREFSLTKEEFISITSSRCHYCNCIPYRSTFAKGTYKEYICNGIDRIDNTKGYTIENSVPCCWRCNNAKKEDTEEDFLTWIVQVYNHSIEKELI